MINLIQEIITRFGPRIAGSEAERNAQIFIQGKCKEFTDDTHFMPFESYLDARFGKLKYFVALFFVSLILFWWTIWGALIVSLVNVVFLLVDFLMYRVILSSFPGKKQTSWNVEASIEPKGNAKSTLIVSGHMDSTREYTWWYRLGYFGKQLTIYAGVLMLLQFVFNLCALWLPFEMMLNIWFVFLCLSPLTIVYWSMQGKNGVPGAHDNLSGITIAYHLFQYFADNSNKGKSTLENTRIRFISFGSEERGLCGAKAYVNEYYDKLVAENAIMVNFDSIRLVDELAVVKKEAAGTAHHPVLVRETKRSFENLQIPCKYTTVPIGGMDSTPFARKGIPTVSMLGITPKDPYYHTRNDSVENIEPKSIENAFEGIKDFIIRWDRGEVNL
ncbi:MAG: M28 family peptidase [Brumimicrobium sp.]|nr:M28 family peptidase [Brumimicrobium sp.]